MFCPKCGSKVEDGAAFCGECGSPLPHKAQQPQPAQSTAASQQQPPEPQQPTSTPQPLAQPADSQQQPPTHKKKRLWPIVVAICVVAVAAITAVVVFVVLPRLTPKGVWVTTKINYSSNGADDSFSSVTTYTLDESGNVVNETYEYDSDGFTSSDEYSFTYDDQGFCTNETSKYIYKSNSTDDSSSDESEQSLDYNWTFDNNGKPIKLVRSDEDGKTTYTHNYEYDDNGLISKKNTIYSYKGSTSSSYDYEDDYTSEFNDQGLVVKNVLKSSENSEESTMEYEYNSEGKPIKVKVVSINIDTGNKTYESSSVLEYDENGNVKSEEIESTRYSDDDSTPTKTTATYTYEHTYIENPTPWVTQCTRLYTNPLSSPY